MSWDRDPLWAKSRLYFEYALALDRTDPRFGLWCTFGLELLARAALSSVSPALLAEPDREHKYLLHAFGRGNPKVGQVSIGADRVFRLCEAIFPGFTSEHVQSAKALLERRNAELHTGEAAFDGYTTQHWLSGFYACCKALAEALGESLETLLGSEEAREAVTLLDAIDREVRERVSRRVEHYAGVFFDKPESEQQAARTAAAVDGARLAHAKHHRVTCPACGSAATVQGDVFGGSRVVDDQGEIVVKQAVSPRRLACIACGLKLEGYGELAAAALGDHYTRTTRYSPEEYYGLLNRDDIDEIENIARETLGMFHPDDREYDNE
jgi:hypothetical protein